MKPKTKLWIGIAVIFVIPLGIAYSAPLDEVYRGIAIIPSVGALFGALFQLFRDDAMHQRNLELQREQHLFNLGATSHMANTVFDKHVEFSEKYLEEVHALVETLTREGPTKLALTHAANLHSLRVEYTAWITPEIEMKLMPFEKAVRQMGGDDLLVSALSGEVSRHDKHQRDQRSQALERIFDTFSRLLDFEDTDIKDEEATVLAVKERIREVLQVKELVQIREYLIKRAAGYKTS